MLYHPVNKMGSCTAKACLNTISPYKFLPGAFVGRPSLPTLSVLQVGQSIQKVLGSPTKVCSYTFTHFSSMNGKGVILAEYRPY